MVEAGSLEVSQARGEMQRRPELCDPPAKLLAQGLQESLSEGNLKLWEAPATVPAGCTALWRRVRPTEKLSTAHERGRQRDQVRDLGDVAEIFYLNSPLSQTRSPSSG